MHERGVGFIYFYRPLQLLAEPYWSSCWEFYSPEEHFIFGFLSKKFFLNLKFLQVNIEILDVNDNKPEFESSTVRISIPENAELSIPLYSAHAQDKDSGRNGEITYKIVNSSPNSSGLFAIDKNSGHLSLQRKLDYESAQRHSLLVVAIDKGSPQLQANLTILVEVQDCNDNLPVFEQNEYTVKVMENVAVNSQVSYKFLVLK